MFLLHEFLLLTPRLNKTWRVASGKWQPVTTKACTHGIYPQQLRQSKKKGPNCRYNSEYKPKSMLLGLLTQPSIVNELSQDLLTDASLSQSVGCGNWVYVLRVLYIVWVLVSPFFLLFFLWYIMCEVGCSWACYVRLFLSTMFSTRDVMLC